MAEPIRDAASATTYRGFSAVPRRTEAQGEGRGPRRSLALPMALTTAAIAAGLAWFLTAPDSSTLKAGPQPAVAPTSIRASTPTPIRAVSAPAAAPPAPAPAPAVAPAPRILRAEKAPAPPAAPVRTAAAPAKAGFHCDWRLRRSERMICGSARLSDLDHQLNHAYGQAVAAGVPRAQLRRQQDAWVFRREAVARSPGALEAYYVRRIRELQAMSRHPSAHHARRSGRGRR